MSEVKTICVSNVSMDRRPYATPTLTKFGHVADLTRGGAPSTRSDNGNNSMRPA